MWDNLSFKITEAADETCSDKYPTYVRLRPAGLTNGMAPGVARVHVADAPGIAPEIGLPFGSHNEHRKPPGLEGGGYLKKE
jgi:hypothetical protein